MKKLVLRTTSLMLADIRAGHERSASAASRARLEELGQQPEAALELIAEEIGNPSQQLIALRSIADIDRGSGRYGQALDHYHTALRLAREIGDPYEEGKILEGIAESTFSSDRQPDTARIVFRQALDIFERLGVPEAESVRIRIETIDPAFSLRVS